MKRISPIVPMLGVAALLAACGAPGENTGTNAASAGNTANANAKPAAAAPTKDALFALDKQANDAWIKGDAKFFESLLSDKFVSHERGKRMDKAGLLKMLGEFKCAVKTWSLEDPQMAMINADTAVISYEGTFDGSCTGPDGKAMKLPSPIRAASVYVREGEKWMGAFHGENLIVDPKAPPAPSAKPEAKKEEPKKDDKMAANSASGAAPAKATGDANTDALLKVELAVWEAWKAKDAKKLEDLTAKDLSFVDIFGHGTFGKADTIKDWTEAKCEIKSVSVTDGVASAISPTVEILTHRGTADGTCYGQNVGAVYGTSVYVKDGGAWKLAFTMNMPTM